MSLKLMDGCEVFWEKYGDLVEKFWHAWFGAYGRELGNPQRVFWEEPEGLEEWVRVQEEAGRPCYMSSQFYSGPDQVSYLDRLFFDFDSKEDPGKALKEAGDLAEALRRYYGARSLLCFSGRKGYHVHVWFRDPIPVQGLSPHHVRELYKAVVDMVLLGLSYETLDRPASGDVKRLSRIPYTRHQKSGLLCVPVDLRGRPVLVFPDQLAGLREHGLPMDLVEAAMKRINLEALRPKKRAPAKLRREFKELRPCVEAILERGPDSHEERLVCLFEMLAKGVPEGEIVARLCLLYTSPSPRD